MLTVLLIFKMVKAILELKYQTYMYHFAAKACWEILERFLASINQLNFTLELLQGHGDICFLIIRYTYLHSIEKRIIFQNF